MSPSIANKPTISSSKRPRKFGWRSEMHWEVSS
jgi:hypothetical protein